MAFTVNFYNFAKRENSTYRPAGSGASYSCVLKDNSSIANPTIILDLDTDDAPGWNYAYIGEFDRYYYVSDWTWIQNRLWSASLLTDLLATFRDDIGSSDLYVLRSSAAYDGAITDSYYPAKVNSTFTTVSAPSPFTPITNLYAGCYVIGINGAKNPGYGSTKYYVMDQSMCLALVKDLTEDFVTETNLFNTADASFSLQKSLIDPIQFITSCVWFPIDYGDMPTTGIDVQDIVINGFEMPTASGKPVNPVAPLINHTFSFTLPNHPQIDRGQYMNGVYRRLYMDVPPFGALELDGTIACNYSKIIVTITTDVISGYATIRIGCGNGNTIEELLEKYESRVGVPMQLSSVYRNTFGVAGGALQSGLGIIGSALTGNLFGMAGSAISGISDVVNNMKPRLESVGSIGSFASYAGSLTLYVQFLNVVDEDLEHAGRPLCQIRRVDTLPGYLLIKDAEIDINGFSGEAEAVRAYLEGGFFYG